MSKTNQASGAGESNVSAQDLLYAPGLIRMGLFTKAPFASSRAVLVHDGSLADIKLGAKLLFYLQRTCCCPGHIAALLAKYLCV